MPDSLGYTDSLLLLNKNKSEKKSYINYCFYLRSKSYFYFMLSYNDTVEFGSFNSGLLDSSSCDSFHLSG